MSTLRELVDKGLLSPNAELVWHRRSKAVTYTAIVQSDGSLLTSDGIAHKTPSGAARHFGKKPVDGWNVWKIKGTELSLASLRARLAV